MKASGPSRVTLESRQDRFLELMMQMCDGGEFAWIKRKVQDAVKRFLREVKGCYQAAGTPDISHSPEASIMTYNEDGLQT